MLGKFASPLMNVAVHLAKNVLASLASMASTSAISITLVISNEDMGGSIRIIKSGLGVLIDGVSETVKHEIKQ